MIADLTYIDKVTISDSSTTQVEFSGIPGDYTDLVLIASLRANAGGTYYEAQLLLNNDATANYNYDTMFSSTSSGTGATGNQINNTRIAVGEVRGQYFTDTSRFDLLIVTVNDYAASSTYKQGNAIFAAAGTGPTNHYAVELTGFIQTLTTNAVTSIQLKFASTQFFPGSTLTLYGAF